MSIKRAIDENRRGKFYISQRLIRKAPDEILENVLGDILITKADTGFGWDSVEYEGYSMNFDVCPIEIQSPEYHADIVMGLTATDEEYMQFNGWVKV